MNWQQWFLIVWFIMNIVATFYMVGRPRTSITLGAAFIVAIIDAFFIYLVASI
jgi:hypothetical protein